MTTQVTDRDLHALLDVVDAGRAADGSESGLPVAVLERAFALIGCDTVSFADLRPSEARSDFLQVFPGDSGKVDGDHGAFWRHYWDCLPCSYPSISGDDRSVTTISDFYSQREFHNTGMYADYLCDSGVEREAMICLRSPAGTSRRLLFMRTTEAADFDARERLLLALLRPHLSELYQAIEARRRSVPDLTPRQWELMRLVAAGHSNAEIARQLVVSALTVRKHLENIFSRLGVTSRTGAVAQAFPSTY